MFNTSILQSIDGRYVKILTSYLNLWLPQLAIHTGIKFVKVYYDELVTISPHLNLFPTPLGVHCIPRDDTVT